MPKGLWVSKTCVECAVRIGER